MKIAITGATGLIGKALVKEAARRGHEVLALVRKPELVTKQLPPGVKADFFDASAPVKQGVLNGCDAVIHLAGEPISERWTPEHKERVLRSRVDGTRTLARAIATTPSVRVFVSGSAVGYYGVHEEQELTEESPPGTGFLAEVCGAWEQAATAEPLPRVRTVLARTGIVLHPDGGALKKMLLPFKLGAGGRMGSGDQYMSWIHLEDEVRLFLFALENETLIGPVNFVSPDAVTNKEFARQLGHALHRPAVLPAPAFALKVALGEMSTMVLEGQRVLPKKAVAAGFTFL
ncbi:MAG: TIGR01777 family oxidoreductase, partial [Myxococcaceae bacterium]